MKKNEFLSQLRKQLAGIPKEDIDRSVEFYAEMIDDRIESGMPEEEAVAELGAPEDICRTIRADLPLPQNSRQKRNKKRSALQIVLICLGSPIWLSLLLALLAVVFAVYAVLWSLLIALYAVVLALLVAGPACILSAVPLLFTGRIPLGLFSLGAGIGSIGIGILFLFACNQIAKGVWLLSKKIFYFVKSILHKEKTV